MNTTRRDMREVMRDEMVMKDRILALLKNDGAQSIPAISEALGTPNHETVYWLMAMRRYGMVEEVGRPDVDGYFKYEFKVDEEN